MKNTVLAFALIAIITCSVHAQIQRTYHWYFGDKAGIDFSSGTAVADTNGKMGVYAGCASISDKNGNLLMYTNGNTVWNRNHQIMPNGDGLWDAPCCPTPFQSSIFVPFPGNDRYYYLFHLSAWSSKDESGDKSEHGLKYSVIDMEQDGGLGDATVKSVMLLSPVSEALGAVMHANCKDVWVVAHKRETNDFYAYLVTEKGIEVPIISTIGNFTTTPNGPYGMKFSADGKKVAISAYYNYFHSQLSWDTLYLFDFNRFTGTLTNKILFPHSQVGSYSFSPDGTKLYVYEWYCSLDSIYPIGTSLLYQYDISSNNQSSILASKTIIAQYTEKRNWDYCDFQMTADNRLFVSRFNNLTYSDTVAVINHPNETGTACNLVDAGFFLNGRSCMVSFPNFIQSYFDENYETNCIVDSTYDKKDVVYIPNIFSPNNDGNNDIFYIRGENIAQLNLAIFDRWGKKVFETNDQNMGWDGTYKAMPMQPAVFVYHLNAVFNSGKQISKSGTITLIK